MSDQVVKDRVYLRPDDEFERVLIEMVELHNKKKHDYARQTDRFSNFVESAKFSGVEPWQVFEVLLGVKQARLNVLRLGVNPNCESMRDTYLDRAIYAVLALAFLDNHESPTMKLQDIHTGEISRLANANANVGAYRPVR